MKVYAASCNEHKEALAALQMHYINPLPERSVLGPLSHSVFLRFPPLFIFRAGERGPRFEATSDCHLHEEHEQSLVLFDDELEGRPTASQLPGINNCVVQAPLTPFPLAIALFETPLGPPSLLLPYLKLP